MNKEGMTLKEAIEVLKRELDGRLLNYPKQLEQAQKLGIEALKQLKLEREEPGMPYETLLPGETEE